MLKKYALSFEIIKEKLFNYHLSIKISLAFYTNIMLSYIWA